MAVPLAGYPLLRAGQANGVLEALALAALAMLVAGCTLQWAIGVRVALLALGAEYVLALAISGPLRDPGVLIYAPGLFLVSELAHWAIEQRWATRTEAGATISRAIFIGVLTVGALALAGLLLIAAGIPAPHFALLDALAVLAAAGAFALTAVAGRGSRH